MIHVPRDPNKAADVLTQKSSRSGKTETEQAIEHYEKWPKLKEGARKSFDFKAYGHEEVREVLMKMFNGKCAYCESLLSTHPMEVEHWRPKSAIFNEDTKKLMKPGYYWLGAAWDNLLASCIDCNRARNHRSRATGEETKLGKANRFPLEDESKRARNPGEENKEKPLLLDPCVDRPECFLEFVISRKGIVIRPKVNDAGESYEKAWVSIEVYGLNRYELAQARKQALDPVEISIENITEVMEHLGTVDDTPMKQKLKELMHKSMAKLKKYTRPEYQYSLMFKQGIERFRAGENLDSDE